MVKRYKKILGRMYESDIGTWVTYKSHEIDYEKRWELNNSYTKIIVDDQYKSAVLINKLKFSIYILSTLLLLALVF